MTNVFLEKWEVRGSPCAPREIRHDRVPRDRVKPVKEKPGRNLELQRHRVAQDTESKLAQLRRVRRRLEEHGFRTSEMQRCHGLKMTEGTRDHLRQPSHPTISGSKGYTFKKFLEFNQVLAIWYVARTYHFYAAEEASASP